MNANSTQVAGTHYAAAIQHWDYVLSCLNGRYLEGNITKYVARHRKKNGLQDLEKAMHYLQKLEEMWKRGRYAVATGLGSRNAELVHKFIVSNGLNTYEAEVMKLATRWNSERDLNTLRIAINILTDNAKRAQIDADAEKAGWPTPESAGEPGPGYVNQG